MERSLCRVARGYGLPLGGVLHESRATEVRAMGRHLATLQTEEAELLAGLITERLTNAALELLKVCGVLEERSDRTPDADPELSPEQAQQIRDADALLRRHTRGR